MSPMINDYLKDVYGINSIRNKNIITNETEIYHRHTLCMITLGIDIITSFFPLNDIVGYIQRASGIPHDLFNTFDGLIVEIIGYDVNDPTIIHEVWKGKLKQTSHLLDKINDMDYINCDNITIEIFFFTTSEDALTNITAWNLLWSRLKGKHLSNNNRIKTLYESKNIGSLDPDDFQLVDNLTESISLAFLNIPAPTELDKCVAFSTSKTKYAMIRAKQPSELLYFDGWTKQAGRRYYININNNEVKVMDDDSDVYELLESIVFRIPNNSSRDIETIDGNPTNNACIDTVTNYSSIRVYKYRSTSYNERITFLIKPIGYDNYALPNISNTELANADAYYPMVRWKIKGKSWKYSRIYNFIENGKDIMEYTGKLSRFNNSGFIYPIISLSTYCEFQFFIMAVFNDKVLYSKFSESFQLSMRKRGFKYLIEKKP